MEALKTRLLQVLVVGVMTTFGFGVNEGYQHYEASEYGVEKGKVSYAQEQLSFYKRNEMCMVDLQPIQVQSSPELSISILACPSGDVRIIALNSQTNQRFSKWLATNQVAMVTDQISFSLLNKAYADDVGGNIFGEIQTQTKICKAFTKGNYFIEVTRSPEGVCREITYNGSGRVVLERNIPCYACD